MIAALFVEKGGVYYGLPDVDPWPEERRRAIKTGACQRLSKRQRAATPPAFRDLLLSIARSSRMTPAQDHTGEGPEERER